MFLELTLNSELLDHCECIKFKVMFKLRGKHCLHICECMVCCCVVQISGESFSVFCNQKLYEYQCHRRKGSISRRAGAKCSGKHAISLTELHAGYLLKRQVQ